MKKTLFFLLLCLPLLANAQQEEIRFFKKTATDDARWSKFVTEAKKHIVDDDDGQKKLRTALLGWIAYNLSLESDYMRLVPEEYRGDKPYIQAFVIYNNLPELMELSEVRRRGREEGFFLPIDHGWLAKNSPESNNVVPQLSPTQEDESVESLSSFSLEDAEAFGEWLRESTQSVKFVGGLSLQIDNLQGELDRLRLALSVQGDRFGGLSLQIDNLQGVLDGLSEKVDLLNTNQENQIQSTRLLHSGLSLVAGELRSLKTLSSKVEEQGGQISQLAMGLAAVKGQLSQNFLWLVSLTGIIVVLFLLQFRTGRRVSSLKKEVKQVKTLFDSSAYGDLFELENPADTDLLNSTALRKMRQGQELVIPLVIKNGEQSIPFSLKIERRDSNLVFVNIPRSSGSAKMTTVNVKTNILHMLYKAVQDGRLSLMNLKVA